MSNTYWARGQQTELADHLGISPQHLNDILHRRRRVGVDFARELEAASQDVLGSPIPWETWLYSSTSRHPAFFGEPEEQR